MNPFSLDWNQITGEDFADVDFNLAGHLAGRELEFAWLSERLGGGSSAGLWSTDANAGAAIVFALGRDYANPQNAALFHFDLRLAQSGASVAASVSWASNYANGAPSGPAANWVSATAGTMTGSAPVLRSRPSLFESLEQLNQSAMSQGARALLWFDHTQSLNSPNLQTLPAELLRSIASHASLSFVFTGQSLSAGFSSHFDARSLGLLAPFVLEDWINARFANAGATSDQIGQACTTWAGNQPTHVIGLATDVFADFQKSGVANLATVELAFRARVERQFSSLAATWAGLGSHEQEALALAARTHLPFDPSSRAPGVRASVWDSLQGRQLIERLPNGTCAFVSPYLKQWVHEQTHRSFGLSLAANVDPGLAGRVSFNFSRTEQSWSARAVRR